ncbi:MAG: AAA family ATPase [Acidobacteriota bacterium]|nr:AAA family ATPase [Acidobacteriota bacterium]
MMKKPRTLAGPPAMHIETTLHPAVVEEAPAAKVHKPRKPKAATALPVIAPDAVLSEPRPIAPYTGPAHSFVVFGDLHFSAKTMDRALRVLDRVGRMAEAHSATIVFVGDWWDRRGVLDVRHIDAIQNVIAKWPRTVIIPGNHDHVSIDGSVHGVRVFEGYPHIEIATKPIVWPGHRVAFLPWREDPAEQAAQIANLEGTDWTIFGHFEIQGATTNHHHVAPGRVTTALIESKARALYAGHYHKRQKLGACSWYVGSPFEQTFGEMDQPHGAALVDLGTTEPVFTDFTDFTRHLRIDIAAAAASGVMPEIRPQDVVEVIGSKAMLDREDIREWITTLPAVDVRPRVEEPKAPDKSGGPAFALSMEEAIGAYVGEQFTAADAAGTDLVEGMTPDDLIELGRALLAATPGARTGGKLGSKVAIGEVRARDFCALRGEISINLDKRGPILICGPIGIGKTALLDSLSWCLFGTTTPRKAGATTASLRADEVIHDDAESTAVTVELLVQRADGVQRVEVTRTKARGKGAGVSIKGIDAPDGIDGKDGDALVRYVLGLDFGLWRACVSLGQGAVGNFVTGADKARKQLLSGAFNLDPCPEAQTEAKRRAQALAFQVDKARIDQTAAKRVREALGEQHYDVQIAEWQVQHEQQVLSLTQAHGDTATKLSECDQLLEGEAGWLESKRGFEAHVTTLTQQLGATTAASKATELATAIGAAQAERGFAERDITRANAEIEVLVASVQGQAQGACPTCHQPWGRGNVDEHVRQIEVRIAGLQRSIATLTHREENLANEASNANVAADRVRKAYTSEIESAREKLAQVGQALQQFAMIKANRTNALSTLARVTTELKHAGAMLNPWEAKAREHAAQLARIDDEIVRVTKILAEDGPRVDALRFWIEGFGPKGVPQLVLRTAMYELETHANAVLSRIVGGRLAVSLVMAEDDLDIAYRKFNRESGVWRERRYEQLSGGERRCIELAFSPFGLSELVFAKTGARVPLLVVDELTTHLHDDEKRELAQYLHELDRETVVIVDHDRAIQAEFENVFDIEPIEGSRVRLVRRTS